MPMTRTPKTEGENATIIQHNSVVPGMISNDTAKLNSEDFGTYKTPVRRYKVSELKPYAQHEKAVSVGFTRPRKRTWEAITIVPNGLGYCTIERDGEVLYDSRDDIPLDMDEFNATREKWRQQWRQSFAQRQRTA